MKKRGFTLVELLGVIVVLSIIALITVPLVFNNIGTTKGAANKLSADVYIKAMRNTIAEVIDEDVDKVPGLYEINEDGNVIKYSDVYEVTVKGDKPTEGSVCVSNAGEIEKAYLKINGKIIYYDGNNYEETNFEEVENIDCDYNPTNSILILRKPITTTKSIIVPYVISDTISGIRNVTCEYGLDENYGFEGRIENGKCVIDGNIKNNTKYYYKVIATNRVEKSTIKTSSITTADFGQITLYPNISDWATSKNVTISGKTEGAYLEYSVAIYNPQKVKYEQSEYVKYNGPITLQSNATEMYPIRVYARFNDGVNVSVPSALLSVTKIDTTPPILELDAIEKTTKSITIPFITNDNESGIDEVVCEYGTDEKYGSIGRVVNSKCLIEGLKTGEYYFKITSKNNVNLDTFIEGNSETGVFGTCTIAISDLGNWTTSKTATIEGVTSGAQLQYRLDDNDNEDDNKWVSISSGATITLDKEATALNPTTVYCQFDDGINITSPKSESTAKIDVTVPTNTYPTVSASTTNPTSAAVVTLRQEDSESGINSNNTQYGYSTSSNGTYTWQTSNTFTGLKSGVDYYFKTRVTNNAGLETISLASAKYNTTVINTSCSISVDYSGVWKSSKLATVTLNGTLQEGTTLQYKVSDNDGVNDTTWYSYSSAITLDKVATSSNKTTITCQIIDAAGNTKSGTSYQESHIDPTAPTNTYPTVSASTTNPTSAAVVTLRQEDSESGINSNNTQYGYSTSSNGTYTWQTSNTFTGLKSGVDYYFKTRVTNNAGLETISLAMGPYSPSSMGTCSVSLVNASSTCVNSRSVTITGNQTGTTLQYRIGTGGWTNTTSGTNVSVGATTVYCRLWDGTNSSGESSLTIDSSHIDLTPPTTTAPTATSTTSTITITNRQTDTCGLNTSTLQYGISESSSGSYTWQSSNKFEKLYDNTTYYVKTRVNDVAGNGLTESQPTAITTVDINQLIAIEVTPNTCSDSKKVIIKGSASGATLQFQLDGTAGAWTDISSGGSVDIASSSTEQSLNVVYARLYDGTNSSSYNRYEVYIDKDRPTSTAPSVGPLSTNPTTAAVVQLNQTDDCGLGTVEYGISSDPIATVNTSVYRWQSSNTFTGLTPGKKYYFRTRANDEARNGTTTSSYTEYTTQSLGSCSIVSTDDNWVTASTGKSVKVTGNYSGSTLQYKIGSNGTWTTISSGGTFKTYSNGYVYCQETKNGSLVTSGSGYVTKIDSSAPSKPTVTMRLNSASGSIYTSGTTTNQNVYHTITSSDSESGISYYQYSHDLNSWSTEFTNWSASYNSTKTQFNYLINWEGSWNFYVRAVDVAGNVGPASDRFTVTINKSASSVTNCDWNWSNSSIETDSNGSRFYRMTFTPSNGCSFQKLRVLACKVEYELSSDSYENCSQLSVSTSGSSSVVKFKITGNYIDEDSNYENFYGTIKIIPHFKEEGSIRKYGMVYDITPYKLTSCGTYTYACQNQDVYNTVHNVNSCSYPCVEG